MTTERPEVRAALRLVAGRAVQSTGRPADPFASDRPAVGGTDPNRAIAEPDRVAATERERPPTEAQAPVRENDEAPGPSGLIASLQAVIVAMRDAPGRKIVAVFSAGVPMSGVSKVDELALATLAAHASIHTFLLPGARDNPENVLDIAALERLSKSTGGSHNVVGKSADKSVERIVPELSTCYVLGLESSPSDLDGKRHALRVEAPRQPVTIHAPAWLVASRDASDVVPQPEPAQAAMAAPGTPGAAPAATPAATTGRARELAARNLELQRLLAKAAEYVTGYQREYSMLVAEEHYIQRSRGAQQQLRSDLLLVRPPGADGWVSFRDVFEVNGNAVRDRDDRLKRLFLEGSPESRAQLYAIKTESARYNIGQVERNINVPLFALTFLETGIIQRSRFRLDGTKDVSGVSATRVSFDEVAKPTVVRQNQTQDLSASGSFLIDPESGAVVGTTLKFVFPTGGATIQFVVRYERDANLGLWVPAEMTEAFSTGSPTASGFDARATYSRFRRFQVQTESEVKIKK